MDLVHYKSRSQSPTNDPTGDGQADISPSVSQIENPWTGKPSSRAHRAHRSGAAPCATQPHSSRNSGLPASTSCMFVITGTNRVNFTARAAFRRPGTVKAPL